MSSDSEKEQPWKRTLDEITAGSDSPRPTKRSRNDASSTTTASTQQPDNLIRLLSQLDNGLDFVAQAENLSPEAKNHASELRRLLAREATTALSKGPEMQKQEHAWNSKHTDVPAPFPGVQVPGMDGVASTGSAASRNSNKERGRRLPPLPNITDLTLLNAPFTHSSTLPSHIPTTGTNTYESLEFLGDAYLEVIATRLIHSRFPSHSVGQKAGLRELLVKNETLAQFSRDYGLDAKIKATGINSDNSTGRAWIKVIADVFEAYVACVILSDPGYGFKIAEDWLTALWDPKVAEWARKGDGKSSGIVEHLSMDVKSELQRFVVSKGVKLEYLEERPMELDKTSNRTTFFMAVYLTGWGYEKTKLGSGSGRSKQLAGAEAAKASFESNRPLLERVHKLKMEHDAAAPPTKGKLQGRGGHQQGGHQQGGHQQGGHQQGGHQQGGHQQGGPQRGGYQQGGYQHGGQHGGQNVGQYGGPHALPHPPAPYGAQPYGGGPQRGGRHVGGPQRGGYQHGGLHQPMHQSPQGYQGYHGPPYR